MNTARLVLTASTAVVALGFVAVAWAAPRPDDASGGSGGARVHPVIPSKGGGSEPSPEDATQLGGAPGTGAGQTTEVPPPQTNFGGDPTVTEPLPTETDPDAELLLLLPGEDRPVSGGAPAREGESAGGGFSFLPSTGFEVASIVTVGSGLALVGLLLRSVWRAKG